MKSKTRIATTLALILLCITATAYVGSYVVLRARGTIAIGNLYFVGDSIHSRVRFENGSDALRVAYWPLWIAESCVRPAPPLLGTRF